MAKSAAHGMIIGSLRLITMLFISGICLPFAWPDMPVDVTSSPIHLTIQGLEDGQLIRKHDLGLIQFKARFGRKRKAGQPILRVDVEKFNLRVNQRPLEYLLTGRGGGHEGDVNYQEHRIAIRPGKPGSKKLILCYDDMKVKCSFNYQPRGQLEFLDLIEQQALWRDDADRIRWVGAYLDADSISLSINGRAHSAGAASGPEPGLHVGTVEGVLARGTNNIELAAKDVFGRAVRIARTVFFYPQNRVQKDTIFAVPTGPMGSRSGPFFRARPVGSALRKLEFAKEYPHVSQPVLLQLENNNLRARRVEFELAWFKAVAPGRSLVPIETKKHFRDEVWRVDRIIELQVARQ